MSIDEAKEAVLNADKTNIDMDKNTVEARACDEGENNYILKPILAFLRASDDLGENSNNDNQIMDYYIPDYQRGYRWGKTQAEELLDDILEFYTNKPKPKEIYCIQPLVVKRSIVDGKEIWEVIDGQQRLTTIFIILSCLSAKEQDGKVKDNTWKLLGKEYVPYTIQYQTRTESQNFLKNIVENTLLNYKECNKNIDYFHMSNVCKVVMNWIEKNVDYVGKNDDASAPVVTKKKISKDEFIKILLNRVCFVFENIDKNSDPIEKFKELNLGKIELTESELIKALYLNEKNFEVGDVDTQEEKLDIKRRKAEIAMEWDEIENTLQNDEFWMFIHSGNYNKTTRIDFIFEMLGYNDEFEIITTKAEKENKEGEKKKRKAKEEYIKKYKELCGDDEYTSFRYMYEVMKRKKANDKNFLETWKKVKDYFRILKEWYNDQVLYHYIGYLVVVGVRKGQKEWDILNDLLNLWQKNGNKKDFIGRLENGASGSESTKDSLKKRIYDSLHIRNFDKEWKYDQDCQDENGKMVNVTKTVCYNMLLLHNIETIILQNKKLVEMTRYKLPMFAKFPFHMFKKDKWEVEHIRPNSGNDFDKEEHRKEYLERCKEYFSSISNNVMVGQIDDCLNSDGLDGFLKLVDTIEGFGGAELRDDEKNKIWNYTLLDKRTNCQYGNFIFPIKRKFIIEKESGKFINKDGKEEITFVPPCTHNVFMKFYSINPDSLVGWTENDAKAYENDMYEVVLKDYFDHYHKLAKNKVKGDN